MTLMRIIAAALLSLAIIATAATTGTAGDTESQDVSGCYGRDTLYPKSRAQYLEMRAACERAIVGAKGEHKGTVELQQQLDAINADLGKMS